MISALSDIIKGKICFTAEDGFTERFVTECFNNDAGLKEISMSTSAVCASVTSDKMNAVNTAAKNSGMTISVKTEKGLPVLIRKTIINIGLPLGLFAGVILFGVLSSIIWTVDIKGCEQTESNKIERILSECGIKRGAFTYNADKLSAEKKLESSDNRIYKASIDIYGSRVFVNITENTLPEDIRENDKCSNIVASKDGIILKTDIFAGCAVTEPGSEVKRGDILVRGDVRLNDGRIVYVDSSARIIASTKHIINSSAADAPYVGSIVSCGNIVMPYLFGICLLPERSLKGVNITRSEYFAHSGNTIFPIGFVRQHKAHIEYKTKKLDERRCFLLALHDLAINATNAVGSINNVSRSIDICHGDQLTLEALFVCEEDIARKMDTEYFSDEKIVE